jgi:Holliday junction resolvase RusA-like endonuclease
LTPTSHYEGAPFYGQLPDMAKIRRDFESQNRFVFEITVDGLPESVNNIWRKTTRGMKKSISYVLWERRVALACEDWVNKFASASNENSNEVFADLQWLARWPYALEIRANKARWRAKTPRRDWHEQLVRPDVTNLVKSSEDAVCKVFKWEDSQCARATILKANGVDSTVIRFDFFDWLDVVR